MVLDKALQSDAIFDLQKFLVPPHNKYNALSKEAVGNYRSDYACRMRTSFTNILNEDICFPSSQSLIETRMLLSHRLHGGIILDLGGAMGGLKNFAAHMGASVYINVDMAVGRGGWWDSEPTVNRIEKEKRFLGTTQCLSVQADMLDFLSYVPDDTCHVAINGIDANVIESGNYHNALVKEIIRVVKPYGIVCGSCSDSLVVLDSDLDLFKKLKPNIFSSGSSSVVYILISKKHAPELSWLSSCKLKRTMRVRKAYKRKALFL